MSNYKKVSLTSGVNEGEIHVDEVDVSKGVYLKAVEKDGRVNIRFVVGFPNSYKIAITNNNSLAVPNYSSLLNILKEFRTQDEDCLWNAFTLSGKRIVTEKAICVDDLKDSDHVGWIHQDGTQKGYVTKIGTKTFVAVAADGGNNMVDVYDNNIQESLKACVKHSPGYISEIRLYPTRRELYTWLAS